jgi:hypothetical protein
MALETKESRPCTIAMIRAAPFNMLWKQQGAKIFIVSFKNILEEQAKEEVIEINLKTILP